MPQLTSPSFLAFVLCLLFFIPGLPTSTHPPGRLALGAAAVGEAAQQPRAPGGQPSLLTRTRPQAGGDLRQAAPWETPRVSREPRPGTR